MPPVTFGIQFSPKWLVLDKILDWQERKVTSIAVKKVFNVSTGIPEAEVYIDVPMIYIIECRLTKAELDLLYDMENDLAWFVLTDGDVGIDVLWIEKIIPTETKDEHLTSPWRTTIHLVARSPMTITLDTYEFEVFDVVTAEAAESDVVIEREVHDLPTSEADEPDAEAEHFVVDPDYVATGIKAIEAKAELEVHDLPTGEGREPEGEAEHEVHDVPEGESRIPEGEGEGPTAEFDYALGREPESAEIPSVDSEEAEGREPEGKGATPELFIYEENPEADKPDIEQDLAPEGIVDTAYDTEAAEPDIEQDIAPDGLVDVAYDKEANEPEAEGSIEDCGIDIYEANVAILTHYKRPTDDCMVWQFLPNGNFNGDPDHQLLITNWVGENAYTYIKFNVTAYPPITLAKLRLYQRPKGGYLSNLTKKVYKVNDDTWTEGAITWNNKPAVQDEIASVTQSGEGWHEWDITSYINAERQIDGIASLCVKMNNPDYWVSFHDKENAPLDKLPELYLEY